MAITLGQSLNRRAFLAKVGAVAGLAAPAVAQAAPRVVVIGGGFAGATVARALKRSAPHVLVTLVETRRTFTACPFSNHVLVGLRQLAAQRFNYDQLAADGVALVFATATEVDVAARYVALEGGDRIAYDRLVITPGVDMNFEAIPGYDVAAAEAMPHAWHAGEQTDLLRRQLESLEDGGLVTMAVPANPYRCPPGPYERASLIAHYLKTRKPRSKLLVLDAKDQFSKQRHFQQAWAALYPNHLEWVGLSGGGQVTAVEVASRTLITDFDRFKAAVVNFIPPQRAGRIARVAGVAGPAGWCPVDPVTFESKLVPGIHVLGDAAIMGAMPKSAFSANAQGKVCAAAILAMFDSRPPAVPKLINTCYSLVAPGDGISVAGVYEPSDGQLAEVKGAGGTSPIDAPPVFRAREANYAESWFSTITAEVFG